MNATIPKMLKELELSYDNFEVVKNHCDEIGIQFLSTPDEIDSLDFLCNFNLPFIKFPTLSDQKNPSLWVFPIRYSYQIS